MTLPLVPQEKWYAQGLRFECTGCGQCCTGGPGFVWASLDEIQAMANHLNLPLQVFADRYLRKIEGRWSLKEDPKTFDCVFLEGKKCSIYSCRPRQCGTFPFWPEYLDKPEAWEKVKLRCEGISDNAPLISAKNIDAQL